MTHRQNTVSLYLGKKGGGKTTLARKHALEYPKRVYCDPMFEITDGVIASNFSDAADFLRKMGDQPRYSLVLRTLEQDDELKLLDLLTRGTPDQPLFPGALAFVDEIDRLCSPAAIPKPLKRLANYGRHFGVSVFAIARSPKMIHADFRRAADSIYVGALNEPRDVDFLNEYTGTAFCDRARTLQDFDFLRWPEPTPT